MSTVTLQNEGSVAGEIISVISAGVILAPPTNLSLEISVPNLGGRFRLELTDLDDSEVENGRVVVKAAVDAISRMVVTLFGDSNSQGFHTKRVSIGFETDDKTAESDYRKATLRAALSLATQTRLLTPGLSLDLWFRLNESLRDISEMLKVRQTMYRLMVIERATGRQFKVPSFIVGEDMEAISFLFHAITERSFGWPFEEVLTVSYKASKDLATMLEHAAQSPDFTYPFSHHKSLFGVEIPLGEIAMTIVDKHIEDFEQVLEELKKDDGHIVAVRVRSRIGLAHYGVPNAPRLPAKIWNNDLQMLIDMEGQLDATLVERYNDLAAASLAGLNEGERAEITARPEIGEAFSIEDTRTERV
jgi:hypothetical protein